MFGMLESLAKAVVGVVTIPVNVAADVVTLGGAITETDKPYTVTAIENVFDNITNAVTPTK